tara:strand:+ start:322 stop:501 length:180 start_codon:yes stop_codon:yes gene_type:complete
MQITKNTSFRKKVLNLVIKLSFVVIMVLVAIFFLNKIDFPAPKKVIEKIISNENFRIVK